MKQSYGVLTAILVVLGLSACDSGDPTVNRHQQLLKPQPQGLWRPAKRLQMKLSAL